jgi:hypothetical protein
LPYVPDGPRASVLPGLGLRAYGVVYATKEKFAKNTAAPNYASISRYLIVIIA